MTNIKVLLISRHAWNEKSNNTLTNFFQDFKIDELAQVYCRDELPDNKLCKNYFRISERQLLKSILHKSYQAGEKVFTKDNRQITFDLKNAEIDKRLHDFFRTKRFTLLLWIRELIWHLGKWKSPQLIKFISEFNPDVIYTDAYDTFYTYDLLHFIHSKLNIPYVIFHCDDQVTYNQFSLSPLFWINRWILRKKVSHAINNSAINYCIIDKQKQIYELIFKKDFKILNKCADFSKVETCSIINNPIKIHYAGNIYYGRWKTLAKLVKSIEKVNKAKQKFFLEIYTSNSVSDKIRQKLQVDGTSQIKNFVPYHQLREIQKKSDILLHVESFNIHEKLITSLSFSTKLVDYFETGKCILAIGWEKAASIEYLKKHDAAITVTDPNTLVDVLQKIAENETMISSYAHNAVACGRKFHDKTITLASFKQDLIGIASQKQENT